MDLEMNDFQPASKLNKAQRKLAQRNPGPNKGLVNNLNIKSTDTPSPSPAPDILSTTDLIRRINGSINFIKEEPEYFESFVKVLDECISDTCIIVEKIVCYGLGPFSSSMTSRFQLALLLRLKEKMDLPIEIYDPHFSPNEKKVLSQEYGLIVLTENEEGKRLVCPKESLSSTLFFMPHAPHQLVNNLLYTNWNPLNLPHMILICNSFTCLKDSTPQRGLSQNLSYIDRAGTILREYGLLNTFHYFEVFNDLAVHVFPQSLVEPRKYETEFWVRGEPPTYKSLEYVQAIPNANEIDD